MRETSPDLKLADREGGRARGQQVREQILRAALSVIMEQGMEAFTLRKVAATANMQLGNLSYHYKSKQDLLEALIDAMASGYEQIVHDISESDAAPEQKLREIISWTMRDLNSNRAKHLLPQMWNLSNFKEVIGKRVQDLYIRDQRLVTGLIREINPAIADEDAEDIAVFIAAALEGFTAFVRSGRPWNNRAASLETLAVEAFIDLIKAK